MNVGRKIYYDLNTGNVIFDTGESNGYVKETSVEQDIEAFKQLSSRNRESFDYIKLPYGEYASDFSRSNGTWVDPETKEIHFSYPEAGDAESEPVYQKPLSEEFKELKLLLTNASSKYDNLNKEAISVEELKLARIEKLKEECSNAIYEGFPSGVNEFGYNEQDQANFTKRLATIAVGVEGPFEWKTKNNGVVELSKEQFIQVITDAEDHQLTHQRKYWELEVAVLNSDTKEAVDAIKW